MLSRGPPLPHATHARCTATNGQFFWIYWLYGRKRVNTCARDGACFAQACKTLDLPWLNHAAHLQSNNQNAYLATRAIPQRTLHAAKFTRTNLVDVSRLFEHDRVPSDGSIPDNFSRSASMPPCHDFDLGAVRMHIFGTWLIVIGGRGSETFPRFWRIRIAQTYSARKAT